jgi:hypothetical protein
MSHSALRKFDSSRDDLIAFNLIGVELKESGVAANKFANEFSTANAGKYSIQRFFVQNFFNGEVKRVPSDRANALLAFIRENYTKCSTLDYFLEKGEEVPDDVFDFDVFFESDDSQNIDGISRLCDYYSIYLCAESGGLKNKYVVHARASFARPGNKTIFREIQTHDGSLDIAEASEEFEGFAFYLSNSICIVAKEDAKNYPKFYIIDKIKRNKGEIIEMSGVSIVKTDNSTYYSPCVFQKQSQESYTDYRIKPKEQIPASIYNRLWTESLTA